jgi:hypothetical protein
MIIEVDVAFVFLNGNFVRSADIGRVKMLHHLSNVGFREAAPQH